MCTNLPCPYAAAIVTVPDMEWQMSDNLPLMPIYPPPDSSQTPASFCSRACSLNDDCACAVLNGNTCWLKSAPNCSAGKKIVSANRLAIIKGAVGSGTEGLTQCQALDASCFNASTRCSGPGPNFDAGGGRHGVGEQRQP